MTRIGKTTNKNVTFMTTHIELLTEIIEDGIIIIVNLPAFNSNGTALHKFNLIFPFKFVQMNECSKNN